MCAHFRLWLQCTKQLKDAKTEFLKLATTLWMCSKFKTQTLYQHIIVPLKLLDLYTTSSLYDSPRLLLKFLLCKGKKTFCGIKVEAKRQSQGRMPVLDHTNTDGQIQHDSCSWSKYKTKTEKWCDRVTFSLREMIRKTLLQMILYSFCNFTNINRITLNIFLI